MHLCQCKTLAQLDKSNPNLYVAACPNCGKYYIYPDKVNAPIECEGEEVTEDKPKPRPAQRR